MNFTPKVPEELSGSVNKELLQLAESIVIGSAKIEGSHNKILLNSLKSMLRTVNSYYSNQIESEGTHPADIERAIRKEYSKDNKEKKLQMLSIAHINTQESLEKEVEKGKFSPSIDFIKSIHKFFYSQEDMGPFCQIIHKEETIHMTPGNIRERDVIIGKHLAPDSSDMNNLLNMFESFYKLPAYMTKSEKLVFAVSSHHRLVWIHPFLDGNGRVSRLFLDAFFNDIGLEGYGLWNISRGLSRNKDEYISALINADIVRQGDRDGRGSLSNKCLKDFVKFMFEIALDQIEYMQDCLKLETLSLRIDNYCKNANEGSLTIAPLPKESATLFKELLLRGEISRGDIQDVIGKKRTGTSTVLKELIGRYYLTSDGPKTPVRINFNTHFASYLFPELMPPEKIRK